jgi:hypothetical protein
MITTPTKWILAAGLACVGGTGVWMYAQQPADEQVGSAAERQAPAALEGRPVAANGPRKQGCSFEPGAKLAYDLTSETRAKLDLSGLGAQVQAQMSDDVHVRTNARLELRVLSNDPQGSVLLGRFAKIAADTVVEDAKLEAPFLVRVSSGCALDGFAHQRDMNAGYARVQQALVHELSWTWPTEDQGRFEGRGANGSYVATVTQTGADESGASDQLALTQTITSFEPWSSDAGSVDQVTGSHQRVVPGQVAWFDTLDARTSFAGERSQVQHSTRVRYADARVSSLKDASTDEQDYVWADLLPHMIALDERPPPTKAELIALDKARKLTVEQALDAYVERVQNKDVGIKDTWPALRTFLEAKPDAASTVIDKMKRGEFPAEATMGVYIALGNTRTPQAKAALGGVMRDENVPVIERSRAILSLIDRSDEGSELASYLKNKSGAIASGKTRGERILARQSMLALGAMSGRKPYDEDIKQTALSQIERMLEETRDKGALYRRPIYGALANVGEPDSLKLVADIPDHADPDVREAAAIVFRRMPPQASADFAARWLAKETDPNVKRKLWHTIELQTFDAREMTSRQVLKYAIRDLRQKPGPITRKAQIRLLARAAEQMPDEDLGIEDAFAELMPYEFAQNSGLHRMMHDHIDPERRLAIYDAAARSFETGANNADTPERRPSSDKSGSDREPTSAPVGAGLPTSSPVAGETAQ